MRHLLFILISTFPFFLNAQKVELGLLFGVSTYQGDIAPTADRFAMNDLHPALGIFGRYNVNPFFTVRAAASIGKLSASDAQSHDEWRRERNLSFQTELWELALTGEFNILGFQPEGLQKRW